MNALQKVFNYKGSQVRTVVKDGEPWFVAKDVCEVLNITWSGSKTISSIKEKWKGVVRFTTPGGEQELIIISEPAIYKLTFRSNKEEAEQFTDWLASEVIPSVRKHGLYAVDELLNDPDLAIKAFTALKEERQKRIEAENKIAIMAPKAEFFDAVADSKTAIEIGEAAKVLNMKIGRNNLFKFLRQKGVLMSNNQPYQEYIDRGYFRVIEQKYAKPDGSTHINIKTLVYQKGLEYIRKLLKSA